MTVLRSVGIRGTGSSIPDKVLSNHDLEALVDTSDDWITQRTGIKERHVVGEGQACSDLAIEAGRKALEAAELSADDLDMIIVATVTPDSPFPSVACQVQDALQANNAGGFDLSAACAGFVNGFITGWQYVATGQCENVLVIGAEALSRITNYEDRTSCILFGDGAGAAVLSSKFERGRILGGHLRMKGSGYKVMWIPAGGSRTPATPELLDDRQHLMQIHGREVYKFAVSRMVELVKLELEREPDVPFGVVIPHQVNMRIIESARERLGLTPEQIMVNIDRIGNTSAASIPIAWDETVRSGRLDQEVGKKLIFCAFGAGLTWGSFSLQW